MPLPERPPAVRRSRQPPTQPAGPAGLTGLLSGARTSTVVRTLVGAVAGPVLASYAAVVALVSLLATTASAEWSAVATLSTAAPLWLAVHQVPLTITLTSGGAAPLGVLPLLPTLGLAVLVARAAAGVAARLDWQAPVQLGLLAVVFAASHSALGVVVALVEPADRMTAAPWSAALWCAATSGLAAAWGGLRAAGFSRIGLALLPAWAVRGVLAGLAGLVALVGVGAVCTFAGLALSAGTVREILASWGGSPGAEFGVTVVSVAYLPNAIVGALSWAAGPGLSVGAVSATLPGTTAGVLPPLPLLAALPEPGAAPWRVLVMVLPLLAGLLVARRCRQLSRVGAADGAAGPAVQDGVAALFSVATAGVVAAAGCFVLAVMAGGSLGGGAFDPVRIPAISLAAAAFGWIVLPAGLVVALATRPRSPG